MRVLVTEDKRRQLSYKILDKVLSKLTREDKDMNVNSVFSNHRVLFKDGNGNIVLKWLENNEALYVYRDFWLPLSVFSFGEEELQRVIFWWFKDRIRIEPEEVYLMGYHSED
jgi:hypothetical protein